MEQNANDPFASENSGTARFVGGGVVSGDHSLDNGAIAGGSVIVSSNTAGTVNAGHEFQTMKPGAGANFKQVGRTEIPHSELVKMLYYLEGELQARDVVIAALRNERVKQYISQLKSKRLQPSDPHVAIFRDKVALSGNLISRESSTQAAQAEMEVRQIIEQQMEQLYQMVNKQRATHLRMVNILTESLENNQRMLQELEDEKRKHEHDTAQGDDITYGLEMERTKLRQELEEERAQVKKLEKDLKKLQETLDFERNRQKQIVLLLIAERKKIMMKYIEEGKRSEDLAQILAEEKQRSDNIAEGLEEESKKSLRMEEELEKQAAASEQERKIIKANLAKEELRVKELEQELLTLRAENEALKKQNATMSSNTVSKSRAFTEDGCATPMANIAKIVQPTATVSSVPVSGPTTGIALSLTPAINLRTGIATAPSNLTPLPQIAAAATIAVQSAVVGNDTTSCTPTPGTVLAPITSASVAQKAQTAAPSSPSPAKMQPTATIQRAPGGKYSALAAAAAAGHSLDQAPSPHPVPIAVPPVTVPPAGARGAPPPIPPNKPIVPPKREPSLSRLGSISGAASVAAVASSASTAANAKN
ncbi:CTTNBP2 N-terminal-like protein isoform X1 [Lucilia cuprina]|uniref:CTTNBP2 N-terminal-like protein isoform X1 n=1 Tax=Lucilia cuprina TaxID=7375 RepID=UPI000C719F2D|nr:CTTNBP2 N-terminal-like protein isoform X1 [Lucilia cuprina]KAI8123676.1 hypothetical protein CVS40_5729 [Lucilia cuprina]